MITDLKTAKTGASCSIALHSLQTPILIGALLWQIALLMTPKPVFALESAANNITLPALQNTPMDDRLMLREISDQYIHDAGGARSGSQLPRTDAIGKEASLDTQTVWEYVKQSTRLTIPAHERIIHYRKQYFDEALWISRILHRASPFAGHVVEELDKRYLPVELALLPVIESGYRPDVHSSQDAAGLWQIVPGTATDIGLSRSIWFDGRADIRQSTTAAIDYLSYLNAEFHGDWLLTLAAYNAGLGRVRSAVKRNADAGLPTDFWSLKLPKETLNYVPKFLALVALLRHDKPRDLELPKVARGRAFDLVDTRKRVSLDRLSVLTGVPEKNLQLLNAGLVHGITPPDGPHLLYLPPGFGKPLIEKLVGQNPQWLYTPPESHVVVAGDNLSSLAERYNISQKRLMALNELKTPLIKIGQTLSVLDSQRDSSQVEYVVTIGDTLSDIAQKFLIDVADIRDEQGQHLSGDTIHPGEKLSLLTRGQGEFTE